jgi:hypothetical protein
MGYMGKAADEVSRRNSPKTSPRKDASLRCCAIVHGVAPGASLSTDLRRFDIVASLEADQQTKYATRRDRAL